LGGKIVKETHNLGSDRKILLRHPAHAAERAFADRSLLNNETDSFGYRTMKKNPKEAVKKGWQCEIHEL
jgi:hypothetical protein